MQFLYSSSFLKQYKKFPQKIHKQIKTRLDLLAEDEFSPLLNNHKLHGEYGDCRSVNITGDFRLVYKKVDKQQILLVEIGTHSKLYE
jgi:addiction module RelE/StbE family toxin